MFNTANDSRNKKLSQIEYKYNIETLIDNLNQPYLEFKCKKACPTNEIISDDFMDILPKF